MVITIAHEKESGEWDVWIALEEGDPTKMGESMIIATSMTHQVAIDYAIINLQNLILAIQEGRYQEHRG